jgi:hypothetical protein
LFYRHHCEKLFLFSWFSCIDNKADADILRAWQANDAGQNKTSTGNEKMATLNQAYQAAVAYIAASPEVHSVNIEFMSEISGPMTATITRDGRMVNVCKM